MLIGMVHVDPLPGTPFYEEGSIGRTIENCVRSAAALYEGGADGCLVQTADRVYGVQDDSDPARTAALTLIVDAIGRATGEEFQVGVQIMMNAVKASLAVAKVAQGSFVKASVLTGAVLTPHGIVEANPLSVMEYRRKIHAFDVKIIAEVETGRYKWLGENKPAAEVARLARNAGADGVALGDRDERRTLDMIAGVRTTVPDLPVMLSGYTNHENASRLLPAADGAFVGACLQRGGWGGPIDIDLVRAYVDTVRSLN